MILHLLDASKTGLQGPSRDRAAAVAAQAPERVAVVVDACQLRCASHVIRSDLARGFMVLITGSKFAGGPPFSGALLIPRGIIEKLRSAAPLPEGLADYSARLDWPVCLRALTSTLTCNANIGLALRWTAALAELTPLAATDDALAARVFEEFASEVSQLTEKSPRIMLLPHHDAARCPSIIPLIFKAADGSPYSPIQTGDIQRRLRTRRTGEATRSRQALAHIVHLGQVVQVGPYAALRVCASAPHVNNVAMRFACGATFADAFEPLRRDLRLLFEELDTLLNGACA